MANAYEVSLVIDDDVVHDSRAANDDYALFMWIGRFALWYFLQIDAVDYNDAQWTRYANEDGTDRLLAFTALKKNDPIDGPHRHGMPTGVLARGVAWIDGKKKQAKIMVRRIEDEQTR